MASIAGPLYEFRGLGVYKVNIIGVRWLPLSFIYIISLSAPLQEQQQHILNPILLQVLEPQVKKMWMDKGLTDKSEILRFLQHGTLGKKSIINCFKVSYVQGGDGVTGLKSSLFKGSFWKLLWQYDKNRRNTYY